MMQQQGLQFQLIVVSPLRRAMQTAHLALETYIRQGVPVVAHPLATEQVTGSDDIGSAPFTLKQEWPNVNWDLMPNMVMLFYI